MSHFVDAMTAYWYHPPTCSEKGCSEQADHSLGPGPGDNFFRCAEHHAQRVMDMRKYATLARANGRALR